MDEMLLLFPKTYSQGGFSLILSPYLGSQSWILAVFYYQLPMITRVNCYYSYKLAIIRPAFPPHLSPPSSSCLIEMEEMWLNIWHDLRFLEEKLLINSEQCDKVASWEEMGPIIRSYWLIPISLWTCAFSLFKDLQKWCISNNLNAKDLLNE